MIFLSCHQESSVFTTSNLSSLGVIPTFSIYGYSYFMLSRKLSSYFIAKILTVRLWEGHMHGTSTFTLENWPSKSNGFLKTTRSEVHFGWFYGRFWNTKLCISESANFLFNDSQNRVWYLWIDRRYGFGFPAQMYLWPCSFQNYIRFWWPIFLK